jgi:hypothetical protein
MHVLCGYWPAHTIQLPKKKKEEEKSNIDPLDHAVMQAARTIVCPLQVVREVKQRWVPAESAEAYADRLWQIAVNNNHFRWEGERP